MQTGWRVPHRIGIFLRGYPGRALWRPSARRPFATPLAGRDRFIFEQKGHACAGLYAALAERGFFPLDQLDTHYQNGSMLSGHASHKVPGVEVSTGSLGHGFVARRWRGVMPARSAIGTHRVVALLSDGECDEGSVWEAVMFAGHHRLKNLTVIVDYNRLQGIAPVAGVIRLERSFADKWRSFGWAVPRSRWAPSRFTARRAQHRVADAAGTSQLRDRAHHQG